MGKYAFDDTSNRFIWGIQHSINAPPTKHPIWKKAAWESVGEVEKQKGRENDMGQEIELIRFSLWNGNNLHTSTWVGALLNRQLRVITFMVERFFFWILPFSRIFYKTVNSSQIQMQYTCSLKNKKKKGLEINLKWIERII